MRVLEPAWQFLRRFETRVLLAFLLAAFAVYGFLTLGGEMLEGETDAFDRRLLLLLRNPNDLSDPIGSRSIEEAVRDVTALGGVTFVTLTTAVGVLLFLFHKRRIHAGVLTATVLLAWASRWDPLESTCRHASLSIL